MQRKAINGTKHGVTQSPRSIADVVCDPLWFADRYDPEQDAIHFRRVDRNQHRAATFLTAEYLGESTDPVIIRTADAMVAAPTTAPLHFIFHSAYCCSTLLARAFDISGVAMGLKEPVILNDIVGWRQRGGDSQRVSAVLDTILTILSRPFASGEAVIVKPSNVCNGLAEAMMALRPDAHALLLYAPLELFLGSVARKGMWGRLWVRELMVKQLREGFIDLGLSDEDYLGLTDLQAAAVGWLAQQALFTRMMTRFGAKRIVTLDSEDLLASPIETMAQCAAHFSLGLDQGAVAAIVSGPAFKQHSKYGRAFGASERAADQRQSADVHAEEIDKVSRWAAVLAENNAIPLKLPKHTTV